MDQVLEGKLEPAALSAISRAAKVLIELYRLADHEMDLIRSRGNRRRRRPGRRCRWRPRTPRRCRRYRRLAGPVPDRLAHRPGPCCARTCRNARRKNQPQARVLTAAGRQRFGYQRLTKYTRRDIDVCRELVIDNPPEGHDLPVALYDLYFIRKNLNELLTDCAPASPPVVDALTGQPLSRLPAAVIPATVPIVGPGQAEQAAKNLQDLLQPANELTRQIEDLYEKRYGDPYDYEEEMEEEEKANKPANLEEIRRHLTDFSLACSLLPQVSSDE